MNIAMMLQIKSYKHSITLDFKKQNFHTLPRQRPDENGMIKGRYINTMAKISKPVIFAIFVSQSIKSLSCRWLSNLCLRENNTDLPWIGLNRAYQPNLFA